MITKEVKSMSLTGKETKGEEGGKGERLKRTVLYSFNTILFKQFISVHIHMKCLKIGFISTLKIHKVNTEVRLSLERRFFVIKP